MASVTGGKVKLSNGKIVNPEQGNWYDGQQYWNGSLSNPGQIHPESNQIGAGQAVSREVIAQTNPNNVSYVDQQRQNLGLTPSPTVNNPAPVPVEKVVAPQTSPGGVMGMTTYSSSGGGGQLGAGLGITASQPQFDLQKIYDAAKNNPELLAKKAEFEKKQKELNDAMAQINDNPFFSEATRVGRIAKLTEAADRELSRIQGDIARLEGDAQTKIDLSLKQYDINNSEYQKNLSYLNTLISTGAIGGANESDLASLSQMTGISSEMLKSVVAKANKGEPPQIVTSVGDDGALNVIAIDPSTGGIVSTSKVSGAGKATASQKDDPYGQFNKQFEQDKKMAPQAVAEAAKAGKVFGEILSFYSQWLDPQTIYNLYNANSRYGPVKADKKTLAQYGIKV